ncbi:hypothetical protein I6F53_11070 [Pseudoalteromonas sp. SWN29]|uniref:hypothetical protein n=1 Tax=Pseudoalteromonas sp. SWN29 TaxID=2792064 RepID=UPI0018CED36E|nr:hypothetical protein [Pseudoalteromonas sp. SWN29]MBH0027525.1 hypothetical protein [Pseudoalteromonas sp. SWN29]
MKKVKIIVPIHISKGGGIDLFHEFVHTHIKFHTQCDFILVCQEKEFSCELYEILQKEAFECCFISNAGPNFGVAVGRNIGLSACQEDDYISFLDYDDKLNTSYFNFIDNKLLLKSYSLHIFSYSIEYLDVTTLYKPPTLTAVNYLSTHAKENFTPCLGTTFKYDGVISFDENDKVQEDYIFWHLLLKSTEFEKVLFSDINSGVYRPRKNSRSSTQRLNITSRYITYKKMGYGFFSFIYDLVFKMYRGVRKYGFNIFKL